MLREEEEEYLEKTREAVPLHREGLRISQKSQGMASGMLHKQVSSQGSTVGFQTALFKNIF